jgi:two-component system chemotaxis response regulator CheY
MDILLVDDSRTMRMIVQRAIRQAGYRGLVIEEAESGAQALEKLAVKRPKLVLSDWNMPEMLGLDLLRNLRAARNQVPFGFVTSESSPEIRKQAEDEGALFLITKPFIPDDFQTALSPVLGGC